MWRPQCLQASNFHFCAASHFGSAVRNQLSTRLERFGRSKRKYLVREYSQRLIMENTDMQILISIIEPFEDIIDCLKTFQRQYNYLICTLLYHSCSTPKHVTKTRSATTSSAATIRLCCRRRLVRLNLATSTSAATKRKWKLIRGRTAQKNQRMRRANGCTYAIGVPA